MELPEYAEQHRRQHGGANIVLVPADAALGVIYELS
jgi:hypothetical protein